MLLILCMRCCCSSSPDCCTLSTLRASWLAVGASARAPRGEHLSLRGNAGRRNAGRVCWCCAVWGECLWQVHCRVWDPTCEPRGDDCRNALWRCHCCNTATTVRCVFERRKPLWTHSLSVSRRCELCVINLFMFPSHAEKPPEATCSAHYRSIFEFSVTFPSILTFEILDMC